MTREIRVVRLSRILRKNAVKISTRITFQRYFVLTLISFQISHQQRIVCVMEVRTDSSDACACSTRDKDL